MTEKFEMVGEWFLPTNHNIRLYGTLTYVPSEEITLKLYGSFRDDVGLPSDGNMEIILGITSDGKPVTLYDCLSTSCGNSIINIVGEHAIVQSATTYSVRYILRGAHISCIDDMKFNSISTEIFNIREWLGVRGISEKNDMDELGQLKGITISYKHPDVIEFNITDDLKGKFIPVMRGNSDRYSTHLTQRVEFKIESRHEKTVEDLLELTAKFQNLIILALYSATYHLSVLLSGEKYKDRNVELCYASRRLQLDKKEQLGTMMLFTYSSIGDNPNEIIKKWYEKYEILAPVFNLLFEQFVNKNSAVENRFLNLAQAAESFHARVFVGTKNKKLDKRIAELTTTYANNILDVVLGDKKQFALDVRISRNYYSHYPKTLEQKALKGSELYNLSERLKILLTCAFLTEAGVAKETIANNLERLKYRYFSHLADWKEYEKEKKGAIDN